MQKNEMINCNNGQIVWVEINLYIACYLLFIHIKKTLKPKWDQPGYSHLFVFFPIGHSQAQCIKDIVQSSFFPPGKPKETCTGQVISCSPPNLCIHFSGWYCTYGPAIYLYSFIGPQILFCSQVFLASSSPLRRF